MRDGVERVRKIEASGGDAVGKQIGKGYSKLMISFYFIY